MLFLTSDASRAWSDFWLILRSSASSAWLMRRAVRMVRIQPVAGWVVVRALIGGIPNLWNTVLKLSVGGEMVGVI